MVVAKMLVKVVETLAVVLLIGVSFASKPLYAADKNIEVLDLVLPANRETDIGQWVSLIYDEACKRAGVAYRFHAQPGKRATVEVNSGRLDGEFIRAHSYLHDKPNLLRVDEPVLSLRYAAFSTDSSVKLDAWSSLQNTTYTIGYRRGTHLSEQKLTELIGTDRLKSFTDGSSAIAAMRKGEIDIYVGVELSIVHLLHGIKRYNNPVYNVGLMDKQPMYLYLHEQHSALIPVFNRSFRALNEEGLIGEYRQRATSHSPGQ